MDASDMKSKQMSTTDIARQFEILTRLPTPFDRSQCVMHKHEILICGGWKEINCYSYHILKNQYKYICSYPKNVQLFGHTVVKRVNNDSRNGITLLSFGGMYNHAVVMHYVSVWDDDDDDDDENDRVANNKTSTTNIWLPLIDNHNKPIYIGTNEEDYKGVRAVIGGSKKAFVNIDIFDLDAFQYVNRSNLPIDSCLFYHCFVLTSNNEIETAKKHIKQSQSEMLLFYKNLGLSIVYDEDSNIFAFYKIWVCSTMRSLFRHG
ncbi:hypothetical protein RFI_31860 [Reticulomyxa filosa]|uniref:Uncharacterized protein n=1 Tax=Reticulomyxa filosa TaxID=46433 RepID=X6LVA1_RETFI|nr:hypothetical protein RFI_31860 [Reticulomyxa filosa]|eukprot:ETO05539.1 hypothetical protein RFI_31860 [Reticulomyxa filosa]